MSVTANPRTPVFTTHFPHVLTVGLGPLLRVSDVGLPDRDRYDKPQIRSPPPQHRIRGALEDTTVLSAPGNPRAS